MPNEPAQEFEAFEVFSTDAADSLVGALPPIDLHWLIEPAWAQNALSMLERIGWKAHSEEFRQFLSAGPPNGQSEPSAKPFQFRDGVAILGLSGPMTKRPQSFSDGTSTIRMRQQVRAAANDPDVKSILLVIDSPGGQASGTHELASDVARAQEKKPVVAYIEDFGASAAYWVASQAGKVYANEPAFVGSIGTYCVVEDWSQAAENAGVKVHLVKAGEFKGAGYPGTPVEGKHLEQWQNQVNRINETFIKSVSNGRKWEPEQAQELADGRIHVARDAKRLGLIDNIRTLDGVLGEMIAEAKRSPQPGAERKGQGRMAGQEQEQSPSAEERIATLERERDAATSRADAAELLADTILTDVAAEIKKAAVRAGMPALTNRLIDSMVRSREWVGAEGLKSFWDEAKTATEKTITPGTSANREKATEEPTEENTERRNSLAAKAKSQRERQLAVHGNGRRSDDA